MAKKRFTILVDEDIIKDFRTYCRKNALKFSAKIELLLKNEMQDKKDVVDNEITNMLRQLVQQKPKQTTTIQQRTRPAPITTEPAKLIQRAKARPINPKIIISKKPIPTISQLVARRRRI